LRGGGYFLIWFDEATKQYAASGYFHHPVEDKALVSLAGLIAEEIGDHENNDEPVDLDACLSRAVKAYESKTVDQLGKADSRDALKLVCSRWFNVRGYALAAIQQWERRWKTLDPNKAKKTGKNEVDTLPRFRLSEAAQPEEILEHHKAAYEEGAEIRASLVQGADARFHIPDAAQIKEGQ